MKCDCKDCKFRIRLLCEQRRLMDENMKMREALRPIMELYGDALCIPMRLAVRHAWWIMGRIKGVFERGC